MKLFLIAMSIWLVVFLVAVVWYLQSKRENRRIARERRAEQIRRVL